MGVVRCAAIDIGSNTTRVLVAEPENGQLRKVLEQRAYTRIRADAGPGGTISDEKVAEVAEVVATQLRLARELGAERVRIVATAAIRDAANRDRVVAELERAVGAEVEVLSPEQEGRLAFLGATKSLGHPASGLIAVVDVGGGSSEVVLGTTAEGVREVHSFRVGSGALAEELLRGDPPSAAEILALRERIDDFFAGVEITRPDRAVAVGGSATSLATVVGAVLEPETLERAVRLLVSDTAEAVARRFDLDPRRVRVLPAGVLLLEKLSELLGVPLQIGRGGLREGVVLELVSASG
jgi:exopolyphosphatase/guanosine-5'-triphosphate,3'-diphosphate pyrophosphatase